MTQRGSASVGGMPNDAEDGNSFLEKAAEARHDVSGDKDSYSQAFNDVNCDYEDGIDPDDDDIRLT
eukprot:CAMPEP_0171309936 /NCGR_PEP_ID=MMETSP0816-20121228/20128_1 /TAXON_ID=420281 /ORGANISM="Proboscia inermis, Strain CCAP1064/1" /LENGTH=65 /DNA_ID=CAMNT_0011793789 /DNA_START=861 /DNA_END=1059 /DNA_ORIENTATION=+